MSGTFLQPRSGSNSMVRRQDSGELPFRRQMDRLFDDFFSAPMWPRFPMMAPASMLEVVVTPQIEVSETDKEVTVTAELPGIDPSQVDVSLVDDVLTIRGEKEQQKQSLRCDQFPPFIRARRPELIQSDHAFGLYQTHDKDRPVGKDQCRYYTRSSS